MENLYFFLILYFVVFILYLFIFWFRKKQNKIDKIAGLNILKGKYNIKEKDEEKLALICIILNTLIISLTSTLTSMLPFDYIWQIAFAFGMLMAFIYLGYGMLARILRKKEN